VQHGRRGQLGLDRSRGFRRLETVHALAKKQKHVEGAEFNQQASALVRRKDHAEEGKGRECPCVHTRSAKLNSKPPPALRLLLPGE
jgi:hypothetical protein